MDPTRILDLLDMRVAFPIYVGLSNMIGVIFATVIKNFLLIRGILVDCLILQKRSGNKWRNGY